jgi:ribosome-associated protein
LTIHQSLSAYELAVLSANAAESKKAVDTIVLETGKVSYIADYFVITSGESPTQIRAISEAVLDAMKKAGVRPLQDERDRGGRWHLLDFGDIVVHVMHKQERQFYQLENFWNHANPVPREEWLREEQLQAS